MFPLRYVFLGVALILLQSCASGPASAKRASLKGEEYFRKGDYADAEIQFRKALQADAKSGEAALWLGRTQIRRGTYGQAIESLRRAKSMMPGQDVPAVELGNALLVAYLADPRHPAELYKQISSISDDLLARHADSYDGTRLKAYLSAADGNPGKAVEYFEKAHKQKPDEVDVVTGLCENLMRSGRQQEAEDLARLFLRKRPDQTALYSMLYQYYMQEKRVADAESILKSQVSNNPKETVFRIELARHYVRSGNAASAAQTLDQMIADPKDFPHAARDVGDFYADLGQWATARRYYSEGVQADSREKLRYWKRLVRADLASGDRTSASQLLDQILKEQPNDPSALTSRAAIRMAANDPGQTKMAIAEFKTAAEKSPGNVGFRVEYADALRTAGNQQEAWSQYLLVLRSDPRNLAALGALAEMSIRSERLDDALNYSDRVLAIDKGNVSASLVRSGALGAKGRFAESRAILQDLAAKHPGLREAQLQLGLIEIGEKRYSDAEARFRRTYQPGKGDVRSLEGLVEVYRAQNQMPRAVELLQRDLDKEPQAFEVRSLLARTAEEGGQKELAVQEYKTLVQAKPQSPELALELGLAYQTAGSLPQAIAEFERAERMIPKDARPYALLGRAQDASGRKPEALAAYRQSLALDNRNPYVMNNLAFLMAETGGNLTDAMRLVQEALQQYPNESSFNDTIGWIYLKQNNFPTAIQIFQRLKQQSPREVEYRIHLGQALLAAGNRNQARLELEAASSIPSSPAEKKMLESLLDNAKGRATSTGLTSGAKVLTTVE